MPDLIPDNAGALAESSAFLAHFEALDDRRQPGKVVYPLEEILLLALLATLAGAETFVDIAFFGIKKPELLRRFLPFAAGTPSQDHLGNCPPPGCRVFPALFCRLGGLVHRSSQRLDGKTSRRAKSAGKATLHTVSAFAARQRLVLGQTKVAEKSDEIVAIAK